MAWSQCHAAPPRSRQTISTPFVGVLASLLIQFCILYEIEDDTTKLDDLHLLVPKEQGVGRTQCFVTIVLSKRHSIKTTGCLPQGPAFLAFIVYSNFEAT